MTIDDIALARAAHVLALVDRRRRRRDDDHLASRRQIAECRIGDYGIRGVRAALRVASLERLLLVVSTPSAAAPVPPNGSAIEQSEVITTVSPALSARGVITRMAEERHADVIVVGPGKRRSLKERILGATADRVIRTSHTSVLVVRKQSGEPYRKVAVAVDFSPQSATDVKEARRLAPEAALQLIHAIDVPLRRAATRIPPAHRSVLSVRFRSIWARPLQVLPFELVPQIVFAATRHRNSLRQQLGLNDMEQNKSGGMGCRQLDRAGQHARDRAPTRCRSRCPRRSPHRRTRSRLGPSFEGPPRRPEASFARRFSAA